MRSEQEIRADLATAHAGLTREVSGPVVASWSGEKAVARLVADVAPLLDALSAALAAKAGVEGERDAGYDTLRTIVQAITGNDCTDEEADRAAFDAVRVLLAAKEAAEQERDRLQAICDKDWVSVDEFMKERARAERAEALIARQLGDCTGCTTEPEETCPRDGRTYTEWVNIASEVVGQRTDLVEENGRLRESVISSNGRAERLATRLVTIRKALLTGGQTAAIRCQQAIAAVDDTSALAAASPPEPTPEEAHERQA